MFNIDVQELLKRGAYFGHKLSRTNPKVLPYVHKPQNGIYIIDLFKTKASLEKALNTLFHAGKNNERLLVVATKKIIKQFVTDFCRERNIPYITEKWIGGFFTNFEEIYKNIKRANDYTREKQTGMWDTMIKHERNKLDKELTKIMKVYGGVTTVEKLPEIVIILDVKKEHNALVESIKIKDRQLMEGRKALQITGVVDTNADPTLLDCPIVANDDSVATLEYVVTLMINAYEDGKKEYKEVPPEEVKTEEKVVEEVRDQVEKKEVKVKIEKPKKVVKKAKVSKK